MAKTCKFCNAEFVAENRSQRYCSHRCRNKSQRSKVVNSPGHWTTTPIICGICGREFLRDPSSSPARKYCSRECIYAASIRTAKRFHALNPTAMKNYNTKRYQKYGRDNLITRLRKKYPYLPTVCEAVDCNEGRVTEIAHKPAFKRNGAHRVLKHYQRHMFWVLCPTCHRLVDYGICTPAELGLDP